MFFFVVFVFEVGFVLKIEDNFCLSSLFWIEFKYKTIYYLRENSFIPIHKMYKKGKQKQQTCRWEKMSKAVEGNKLAVWKTNIYENSIYISILCVQTKIIISYSFFNCWKTTKSMTLKCSGFQFVSINCFVKKRE